MDATVDDALRYIFAMKSILPFVLLWPALSTAQVTSTVIAESGEAHSGGGTFFDIDPEAWTDDSGRILFSDGDGQRLYIHTPGAAGGSTLDVIVEDPSTLENAPSEIIRIADRFLVGTERVVFSARGHLSSVFGIYDWTSAGGVSLLFSVPLQSCPDSGNTIGTLVKVQASELGAFVLALCGGVYELIDLDGALPTAIASWSNSFVVPGPVQNGELSAFIPGDFSLGGSFAIKGAYQCTGGYAGSECNELTYWTRSGLGSGWDLAYIVDENYAVANLPIELRGAGMTQLSWGEDKLCGVAFGSDGTEHIVCHDTLTFGNDVLAEGATPVGAPGAIVAFEELVTEDDGIVYSVVDLGAFENGIVRSDTASNTSTWIIGSADMVGPAGAAVEIHRIEDVRATRDEAYIVASLNPGGEVLLRYSDSGLEVVGQSGGGIGTIPYASVEFPRLRGGTVVKPNGNDGWGYPMANGRPSLILSGHNGTAADKLIALSSPATSAPTGPSSDDPPADSGGGGDGGCSAIPASSAFAGLVGLWAMRRRKRGRSLLS